MADDSSQRRRRTMSASTNDGTLSQASSTNRQIGSDNTIQLSSDEEAETPNKDDLNDADYEQFPQRHKLTAPRSKNSQRRPRCDNMNREAVIGKLHYTLDELAVVKKKRADDRKERDSEKKQRIKLQKENKQLLQQIANLNDHRRELRRINIEQQNNFDDVLEERGAQLAQAQEDWLAKIKESTYPSLPDNVVRDQFHGLLSRCKDWVRQWYRDQPTTDAILFLEKVVARCASDQREHAKGALLSRLASGNTILLRALGFAWLAREMVQVFFESPFFACGSSRRNLEELYYKLSKQRILKKVYSWRAETLRLVRDDLGIHPSELRGETLEPKVLGNLCASTMRKIVCGEHAIALREVTPEEARSRRMDLAEICHGFCLLALELWCQKPEVDVIDDAVIFREPFSMHSTLQQPHVSMGMDEDDDRFDGALPHAVLVPAIRVLGDLSGNNMEQEKVLSRAVVLIFEDASSRMEESPPSKASESRSRTLVNQPTQPKVPDIREPKRRKLSSENDLLEEPQRVASTISASSSSSSSTAVSLRTASSHTESRKASQWNGVFTGILAQIEKGNTYDRVQKQQRRTVQEENDSHASSAPAQQLSSIFSHPPQAGDELRHRRSTPESEKCNEEPRSKLNSSATTLARTPSVVPSERNESSKLGDSDNRVDESESVEARKEEKEAKGDTTVVVADSSAKKIKIEPED